MSNHEFTETTLHKFTSRYSSAPQDYISIDLIGPYNTTSHGNSYCLTTVCNLTGYLLTTPVPDQKTAIVAMYLFSEIMLKFSFQILHSDSGTQFKSELIEHQQLGIKKTYISPHHPQSNGKLESSHRLIKDCIWKFSINGTLEWDQLLPYATAALNWFPNEHSQEYTHFLNFRHDPYLPHLAAFL